jgi:ribosomal protein S18 acetylase RimI-like enzyme
MLIFRPIREDDLPKLTKLAAEIFNDTDPKHALEVFSHTFNNSVLSSSILAIDEESDQIIGAIFAEHSIAFRSPNSAYIRSLFIQPKFHGKGVGQELLSRCTKALKAAKIAYVTLQVYPDNQPAIALYEKEGFRLSRYVYSKEI